MLKDIIRRMKNNFHSFFEFQINIFLTIRIYICYNKIGDNMKNKDGFTLVELLAVIAILALLVILALPNVISMFNQAKKEIFLTEIKKIYSESKRKYISNSVAGSKVKKISSEDNSKLDMTGEKLQYCIILNNNGKVKSMKVSNGKWVASLDNDKKVEDLTINDLEEGNLDGYRCSANTPNVPKPVYCTFDGDLKQGTKYVNGQYTYKYMQYDVYNGIVDFWVDLDKEGWGVILTDRSSTDPITTPMCTYINDKPIVAMNYMFTGSKATSIDLSGFNTSNVTSMTGTFSNLNLKSLDLSNLDTHNVSIMADIFMGSTIDEIDLSTFDTTSLKNTSRMFSGFKTNKLILTDFDTSKVMNMQAMFRNVVFETLDLSELDTSSVTDMRSMFENAEIDNLILNNFTTGNAANLSSMFKGLKIQNLNLSNFDTSKATNMSRMFSLSKIQNLNLNGFNTSNVTNMQEMFRSANINILDLSSFDTSNVTNTRAMFMNCSNLETIFVSDKFTMDNVSLSTKMFSGSTKLVGENGTKYDSSMVDKTYARIDKGTDLPGYFSIKK